MFTNYHLARITLEAVTPLSIATGINDGIFDISLVRDVNGLPTLPGSAIAGVLRHLYWDLYGKQAAQVLFGYQKHYEFSPSRLHISWGYLQDSTGQPVEGLLLGADNMRLTNDPILNAAMASRDLPNHRDRVHISHRGSTYYQGKFNRAILPAGNRFSVEIVLWSNKSQDPVWEQILELFQHPLFRIGGSTRGGLGRIKLVHAHTGQFDLQSKEGRKAFSGLAPNIGSSVGLTKYKIVTLPKLQDRFITAKLKLIPHGFWRIGQGDNPQIKDDNGKEADVLPKLESRIVWYPNAHGGETAKIESIQLLVPTTALKGVLSHRVVFHANRHKQCWAEDILDIKNSPKAICPEAQELFGSIQRLSNHRLESQNEATAQNTGAIKTNHAGRVLFDDSFIKFTKDDLQLMTHNVIDRFTGGVREHMLFMEELVWKKEIVLRCVIDTQGISDSACHALHAALDDLCNGRLSLGTGAAQGHGFLSGIIEWSDNGRWIGSHNNIGSSKAA
ncbi:hypothetical protein TI05_03780 [Achromatium sp. WMS3]|nr:hypothetical protein TI05_03780 [Achromatium sp. WMS3]